MPVSTRLRFEIFRRDGSRCRYCGTPAPESGEGLTIDHVVPVALGGTDDPSNLVAACKDCNSGKTSSSPDAPLVAQVADDALRWAAAIRQAHATAGADLHRFDTDVRAFAREWKASGLDALEPGWQDSVRRFLHEGMSRADLLHFVPVVANRRVKIGGHFRYFCGCVLNEMDKRHAAARVIVSPPAEEDKSYEWYFLGCDLVADSTPVVVVNRIATTVRSEVNDAAADGLLGGWIDWHGEVNDDRHLDLIAEIAEACAGGHAGQYLAVP